VKKKGNIVLRHTHMHEMAWTCGLFVAVVSMWVVTDYQNILYPFFVVLVYSRQMPIGPDFCE